eukprot:UN15080
MSIISKIIVGEKFLEKKKTENLIMKKNWVPGAHYDSEKKNKANNSRKIPSRHLEYDQFQFDDGNSGGPIQGESLSQPTKKLSLQDTIVMISFKQRREEHT